MEHGERASDAFPRRVKKDNFVEFGGEKKVSSSSKLQVASVLKLDVQSFDTFFPLSFFSVHLCTFSSNDFPSSQGLFRSPYCVTKNLSIT